MVQGSVGQATAAQGASGVPVHTDAYGSVLKNNDTATFRTLPVLRSAFPNHLIVLGMGLDNMLQLIYWKNLNVYNQFNVDGFYAVNRELEPTDKASAAMFQGVNFQARLQKVIPWPITGNVLIERFGRDATIKCGGHADDGIAGISIESQTTYKSNCSITSDRIAIHISPLDQLLCYAPYH